MEIKRHYEANKSYYLEKAKRRNLIVRKRANDYISKYFLSHPCTDCGEQDPVVLEFDHIRDKFDEVSKMRVNNSFEKLKLEIDKCEVRCANCHRRKTMAMLGVKIYGKPL